MTKTDKQKRDMQQAYDALRLPYVRVLINRPRLKQIKDLGTADFLLESHSGRRRDPSYKRQRVY